VPRALEPNTEIKIVLKSDQDKTENVPSFSYRSLDGREWRQVALVNDQIDSGELSASQSLDLIYKTIGIGLIGWENMIDRDGEPIPFDINMLDMVIDPVEASADLMAQVLGSVSLDIEDKKKLEPSQ